MQKRLERLYPKMAHDATKHLDFLLEELDDVETYVDLAADDMTGFPDEYRIRSLLDDVQKIADAVREEQKKLKEGVRRWMAS